MDFTKTEYLYVCAAREALGRKFEPGDVRADPNLARAAVMFARDYLSTGQEWADRFMRDMAYWHMRKGLSDAQLKGILNTLTALASKANKPQPAPTTISQVVPNGTYTVIFNGDDNDYVTLRLKDNFLIARGKARQGSQVVQYLHGPDNSSSYTGFGFVEGQELRVWSKFSSGHERQKSAIAHLLSTDLDGHASARETYAERSGCCSRCGRKLTVPTSLHRGLGPICAAELGF